MRLVEKSVALRVKAEYRSYASDDSIRFAIEEVCAEKSRVILVQWTNISVESCLHHKHLRVLGHADHISGLLPSSVIILVSDTQTPTKEFVEQIRALAFPLLQGSDSLYIFTKLTKHKARI